MVTLIIRPKCPLRVHLDDVGPANHHVVDVFFNLKPLDGFTDGKAHRYFISGSDVTDVQVSAVPLQRAIGFVYAASHLLEVGPAGYPNLEIDGLFNRNVDPALIGDVTVNVGPR